jgi:hypothetical protein
MIKLFSVKVPTPSCVGACTHVHARHTAQQLLFHPQLTRTFCDLQDKQKKDAIAAAAGKPKQSAGELRLNKGIMLGAAAALHVQEPPSTVATAAAVLQSVRSSCT